MYSYYVNTFIENVILTDQTDYGSRASVQKHNLATDKHRDTARIIGQTFPERIDDFAELLPSEHLSVRLCCAVSIAELMPASPKTKERAIQQIKTELKNGNATPAIGWEIWLKKHDI